MKTVVKENANGGKGQVVVKYILDDNELNAKCKMFAEVTIAPGCSLGYHEHHGESERARVLGLEIIGHMRARMDQESEKRHLNFSLLATPAEGLSGRFVKIDKEKSTEKVDGAVALVMALDRAMKNQGSGSVYDERGLLFI